MPTIHLLIKGKVQGVFYRASAKKIADELAITGWIKNTADEHVEATICGAQPQLDQFIEWCKRGPKRAIVDHVISAIIEDENFKGFKIRR